MVRPAMWLEPVHAPAEPAAGLHATRPRLTRAPPAPLQVLATLKRECSRMSQRAMVVAMKQEWSPVQQRMLMKALPVPFKYADYLMTAEGMAAASTHPGDWRYKDFDYE